MFACLLSRSVFSKSFKHIYFSGGKIYKHFFDQCFFYLRNVFASTVNFGFSLLFSLYLRINLANFQKSYFLLILDSCSLFPTDLVSSFAFVHNSIAILDWRNYIMSHQINDILNIDKVFGYLRFLHLFSSWAFFIVNLLRRVPQTEIISIPFCA